jgi:TPR repeat protein
LTRSASVRRRRAAQIVVLAMLVGSPGSGQAAAPAQCAGIADPEAALAAGTAFDTGFGAEQDFVRAASCYRVAALAGNARAQFNLGALYDNGRGVLREPREAVHWYERAAAQGHGRAAYALGLIFENGDGIARDLPAARRWYEAARTAGIVAAKRKLENLNRREAAVGRNALPGSHQATKPATYKDAPVRACRETQSQILINGWPEIAVATICLDASGRWIVVAPPRLEERPP